jgi:hypothetical protein
VCVCTVWRDRCLCVVVVSNFSLIHTHTQETDALEAENTPEVLKQKERARIAAKKARIAAAKQAARYVCVCLCGCVFVYVVVCVCMWLCVCVCVGISEYLYTYTHPYARGCVCVGGEGGHMCIFINAYTYM